MVAVLAKAILHVARCDGVVEQQDVLLRRGILQMRSAILFPARRLLQPTVEAEEQHVGGFLVSCAV